MEKKRVLAAMSGGVDSSVAAWLMQERGMDCRGVTMKLFPGGDSSDARRVCEKLNIPFEEVDFSAEFRREVMEYFVRTYEAGQTPNPCVVCNRRLKFGALLDWAAERGYGHVATGHYARIVKDLNTGRYLLKKALDQSKDQSYVLARLTQEQLSRAIFPLGELDKAAVRQIAAERGFSNAGKKDSQDICFIPDGDYLAFMEAFRGKKYPPGEFIDGSGAVLGRHRGAVGYTIGQRKGLGVSADGRLYVQSKDMTRNTVTLGPERGLYSAALTAGDMNWIAIEALTAPVRVKARTRYNQKEQSGTVFPGENNTVRVEFDAPQRAVTPGQTLVLYDGDTVVGGGVILQAEKEQNGDMPC